MGKIKRQGIGSSIFMYIGLVLGFINSTLLFPKILGKEIYGFCQFLVYMSSLIAVFSLLGLPQVTIRFFSCFRDKENQHQGYFSFLATIISLSTGILVVILILFKPQFIRWFGDGNSGPFIDQFYWGLIFTFILTNFVSILTSYSTALQRPRIPTFFSQVFGRLVTLVLIIAFYYQWIKQENFIWLYSLKQIPNILGLLLFIFLIGELHTKFDFSLVKKPVFKEMREYGLYSILAHIGGNLINRIDMIMIAALLSWGEVGIYSVFFFLSSVIKLSHNGMAQIASPVIAEYWQKNNTKKIDKLYTRMATNNFIPAILIFIGIIANLENVVLLLGEDYRSGTTVAIYLGIAQLLNVLFGYNGLILIHSPLYKYDLVFRIIAAILTVVSNYFMINWFGLNGAAIATLLTILVTNTINLSFVYNKFKMHPFSTSMIYTTFIAAVVLGISLIIPPFPGHFVWDIILRSGGMTLSFGILILAFNVAPDITNLFYQTLATIRKKLL